MIFTRAAQVGNSMAGDPGGTLVPAEYQLMRVRYRPLRGSFSFLQRYTPEEGETDVFLHDSNVTSGGYPRQGDVLFAKVEFKDDRKVAVHAIQPHKICSMLWKTVNELSNTVQDLNARIGALGFMCQGFNQRVSALEGLEETALDQSTAVSELFVNVEGPRTAPPGSSESSPIGYVAYNGTEDDQHDHM